MKKKILYIIILLILFTPIISVMAAPKVSCGNVTRIPGKIPELTSMAITMIQIAVPVVLVVMGSLDLFKGVTAGKEDEIKKGQKLFIKRLIVAGIIFFVIVAAKFVISIVAESSSDDIIECIDCFTSNNCKKSGIFQGIESIIENAKETIQKK